MSTGVAKAHVCKHNPLTLSRTAACAQSFVHVIDGVLLPAPMEAPSETDNFATCVSPCFDAAVFSTAAATWIVARLLSYTTSQH
jgi:hypothetical protein